MGSLPHSDVPRFSTLDNVVKSIHSLPVSVVQTRLICRAQKESLEERDERDWSFGVESVALIEIHVVCAESFE